VKNNNSKSLDKRIYRNLKDLSRPVGDYYLGGGYPWQGHENTLPILTIKMTLFII
jgi:hypothetical protein